MNNKIGVISCSGEECLGGTLSRLATRRVMEKMHPGKVVSLCLPLYIAGGEEERGFAKEYPVIAVDGCKKCCAKRATLKYSGEVQDELDVSDIIGEEAACSNIVSARQLKPEHQEMVVKLADVISQKVKKIIAGRQT